MLGRKRDTWYGVEAVHLQENRFLSISIQDIICAMLGWFWAPAKFYVQHFRYVSVACRHANDVQTLRKYVVM